MCFCCFLDLSDPYWSQWPLFWDDVAIGSPKGESGASVMLPFSVLRPSVRTENEML